MTSIADIFSNSKPLIDGITKFVGTYIGASLLRKCRITKVVDLKNSNYSYEGSLFGTQPAVSEEKKSPLEKCVPACDLLVDKILAGFLTDSPYELFKEGLFPANYGKDTYYRFDHIKSANWESLLTYTAASVTADINERTVEDCIKALIFDDSLYNRAGGKHTMMCGKVYDHNTNTLKTGYRMMTCGVTNGDTFVPIDEVLLTTRDDKLMVGPDVHADGRTVEGRRLKRAKTKGTEVVLEMTKRVQEAGIPFDYVLFDTWFSNPSQLAALDETGAKVIAMIKKNSTRYTWVNPKTAQAENLNVKEIYGRNKKRRGRSKYLLSVDEL